MLYVVLYADVVCILLYVTCIIYYMEYNFVSLSKCVYVMCYLL